MAATLRRDWNAEVEMVSGGFGELRVTVDGRDAYVGHRFFYTTPRRVVAALERAVSR